MTAPFECRVCGGETLTSFIEPTAHEDVVNGRAHFRAWCEAHCPGHVYERFEDWPECKYCCAPAPPDYYDGWWDDLDWRE